MLSPAIQIPGACFLKVLQTYQARKITWLLPNKFYEGFSNRPLSKILVTFPVTGLLTYGIRQAPLKLPGSNILAKPKQIGCWRQTNLPDLPQGYPDRPALNNMAETDIMERCRLSRGRMYWLVEQFREDLERDTKRSCLLSMKTEVNVL